LPDRHPNSRRTWRLNSIMGLRVMLEDLSPASYAADPETLAAYRKADAPKPLHRL